MIFFQGLFSCLLKRERAHVDDRSRLTHEFHSIIIEVDYFGSQRKNISIAKVLNIRLLRSSVVIRCQGCVEAIGNPIR